MNYNYAKEIQPEYLSRNIINYFKLYEKKLSFRNTTTAREGAKLPSTTKHTKCLVCPTVQSIARRKDFSMQ